jgi:regulator of cell morphogenesis and NO signaling
MDVVDPDNSVPDLIIEHPRLMPLLEELGIDCTCGGKSLNTACRERGLSAGEVIRQFEDRLHGNNSSDALNRLDA